MMTDTDLTLFHKRYDAATRRAVWDAAYVASASCHRRAVVTLTGDGLQCADLTELRIPTGEVLSIANGDRAIFGHCEAARGRHDGDLFFGQPPRLGRGTALEGGMHRMKTVNTMEAIRDFILGCPYLKDGYLQVDFLGDKPVEYTLDTSPEGGALRRYADGSSLCEFVFVFASREHYGADVVAALENCGFYERFAAWLDEHLPLLGEGRRAQKIEAVNAGCLKDANLGGARYEIKCRLVYQKLS